MFLRLKLVQILRGSETFIPLKWATSLGFVFWMRSSGTIVHCLPSLSTTRTSGVHIHFSRNKSSSWQLVRNQGSYIYLRMIYKICDVALSVCAKCQPSLAEVARSSQFSVVDCIAHFPSQDILLWFHLYGKYGELRSYPSVSFHSLFSIWFLFWPSPNQ